MPVLICKGHIAPAAGVIAQLNIGLFSPSLCRLKMAATATGTVPPTAHPGPNGGNLHSCPNGSAAYPGNQDPRLQSTTQEPGPSAHQPPNVSARPVLYVPAPPPPPFLQYQWPMPFSYNPFTGFPGVGESFSIYFNLFFSFLHSNIPLIPL